MAPTLQVPAESMGLLALSFACKAGSRKLTMIFNHVGCGGFKADCGSIRFLPLGTECKLPASVEAVLTDEAISKGVLHLKRLLNSRLDFLEHLRGPVWLVETVAIEDVRNRNRPLADGARQTVFVSVPAHLIVDENFRHNVRNSLGQVKVFGLDVDWRFAGLHESSILLIFLLRHLSGSGTLFATAAGGPRRLPAPSACYSSSSSSSNSSSDIPSNSSLRSCKSVSISCSRACSTLA